MAKEIKRTVVKASDAKAAKAKKAKKSGPDEVEKVKRTKAAEEEEILEEEIQDDEPKVKKAKKSGGATGKRVAAVIFWLLAIAAEVAVIMMLNGYLYIPGMPDKLMTYLIVGIVIDLVLVVIGSQFWKKANHIDPPSKKNKVWFFICSQMGLIVSVIAFCPLIVILLRDKNLDKKTKRIVSVIAAVALVLAGALSIDYDPVSAEEVEAAKAGYDGVCYWTMYGRSYHFDMDCHTLARSSTLYEGTIEEAYEASRTDPCDYCAEEFDEELEDAVEEMLE